jgi:hypothetical protein
VEPAAIVSGDDHGTENKIAGLTPGDFYLGIGGLVEITPRPLMLKRYFGSNS